jgi:hypothetical protein
MQKAQSSLIAILFLAPVRLRESRVVNLIGSSKKAFNLFLKKYAAYPLLAWISAALCHYLYPP